MLWIRQQQSGRTRVVNREKVKLVDPKVSWDESRPRPLRVQRRHKALAQREPESEDRQEEPESGDRQEEPESGDRQEEPESGDRQEEPESGDRQEEPNVPVDRAPVTALKRRRPANAGENPNGTTELVPGRRSTRRCRPSVRAQEATMRHEGEMDVDPEVTYLRKRTGGYIDETGKKRARLEAIALVTRLCA